jgi:enolase
MGIEDTTAIDDRMCELDGTPHKSNLGANAMLAVSLASARLAAKVTHQPLYEFIKSYFQFSIPASRLPLPMMNILNGGKHSDAGFSIQEFLIIPKATSFHERVRIGSEVFQKLGDVLHGQGFSTLVGDEGGYGPKFSKNTDAFDSIIEAVKNTNYHPGEDLTLGIDAAASNFYEAKGSQYRLQPENKLLSAEAMIKMYAEWTERYQVASIEDGLREDGWEEWKQLTNKLGKSVKIVGDDLFATNEARLQEGIQKKAANAIIIKPNQIGTLSETVDCVKLAQKNHYAVIVSHRSGETIDDFIADLAVGVGAEFIKTGSLCRGERLAKYNRLLEIEMELGEWKQLDQR